MNKYQETFHVFDTKAAKLTNSAKREFKEDKHNNTHYNRKCNGFYYFYCDSYF